jgi:hypothetical protein
MKILHSLLLTVLALGGLACAADLPGGAPGGIVYASDQGAATPEGLYRIEWQPFQSTFVKPGADLRMYDKVMVEPVTIAYKTPPRPDDTGGEDDMIIKNYALPEASIKALEKAFHDVFVKELGKSKDFTVVTTPGPDVLRIAPRIIDLQVTVPPQGDQDLGTFYHTFSAGSMTLVLEAQDSQSHEPLVAVGQTRDVQLNGAMYSSNPAANSGAVQQLLQDWASELRQELDQFHSLPRLPALPASAKMPAPAS